MKRVLLVASLALLGSALEAQAVKESHTVGIETDKPRATLDVNGDVRVQKTETAVIPSNADCPCFLVVDENGLIKKVPIGNGTGSGSGSGSGGRIDPGNLPPGYVLDRNYGDGVHDFVYKVVLGSDGRRWLNNNLGAEYANVHSQYYNPDQQATSRTDYHAYGSLFQWQRKADGHELMGWHSATDNNPTNTGTTGTLASSWTNAGTNEFILSSSSSDYNWVSNGASVTSGANAQLWRDNGATNPCPVGYHVPTKAEWVAYHEAVTGSSGSINNGKFWNGFNADILRLPAAGYRNDSDGALNDQSSFAYYWSSESSTNGDYAWYFGFRSSSSYPSNYSVRTYGYSVRCLQD